MSWTGPGPGRVMDRRRAPATGHSGHASRSGVPEHGQSPDPGRRCGPDHRSNRSSEACAPLRAIQGSCRLSPPGLNVQPTRRARRRGAAARREQVRLRVGHQVHHGLQVGPERRDAPVPGVLIGRGVAPGPGALRERGEDLVRVDAEADDVPSGCVTSDRCGPRPSGIPPVPPGDIGSGVSTTKVESVTSEPSQGSPFSDIIDEDLRRGPSVAGEVDGASAKIT